MISPELHNQMLQRTSYVFTPFATEKVAPTQPAAELRRYPAT